MFDLTGICLSSMGILRASSIFNASCMDIELPYTSIAAIYDCLIISTRSGTDASVIPLLKPKYISDNVSLPIKDSESISKALSVIWLELRFIDMTFLFACRYSQSDGTHLSSILFWERLRVVADTSISFNAWNKNIAPLDVILFA